MMASLTDTIIERQWLMTTLELDSNNRTIISTPFDRQVMTIIVWSNSNVTLIETLQQLLQSLYRFPNLKFWDSKSTKNTCCYKSKSEWRK